MAFVKMKLLCVIILFLAGCFYQVLPGGNRYACAESCNGEAMCKRQCGQQAEREAQDEPQPIP